MRNALLFCGEKQNYKMGISVTLFGEFTSSRREVFCKNGVLKNIAKFTGKHLCQRLFFNKVAGPRPATLLKKSLWHEHMPILLLELEKESVSLLSLESYLPSKPLHLTLLQLLQVKLEIFLLPSMLLVEFYFGFVVGLEKRN